jgi:proteasome lid subunit RPN8/RPN11
MPFKLFKDDRANITGIRKKTLRMIMEASKSSYPEEFGAILRAEKGVISELLLLPGTISGESSALFQLHNLPIDFTIVGTVHSHPTGSTRPSRADLQLFRKYGWVHLIVGYPYSMTQWACYDVTGRRRPLEVV